MYEQFGYPGLFAAYNAGPGRYAQHLAVRRALPDETVRYLASVTPPTRVPSAAVAVAPPPMSLLRSYQRRVVNVCGRTFISGWTLAHYNTNSHTINNKLFSLY